MSISAHNNEERAYLVVYGMVGGEADTTGEGDQALLSLEAVGLDNTDNLREQWESSRGCNLVALDNLVHTLGSSILHLHHTLSGNATSRGIIICPHAGQWCTGFGVSASTTVSVLRDAGLGRWQLDKDLLNLVTESLEQLASVELDAGVFEVVALNRN